MKILVIQQKMIGDVLTSSILLEILRQHYPNAQLDYVINTNTKPVVKNNPEIDNLKLITPQIEKSKRKFYGFLKSIRREKYDIVIDVYSKLSSNLITLFSGAKTKISYYKHYSTWVYHQNIKRQDITDSNAGLAIVNRLQLLEPLGIKTKVIKPKIYLTQEEKESAKQQLLSHGIVFKKPLLMISVLGSGINKTYPFEYMAETIDMVAKATKGDIIFNYIPKQEEDARAIYNLCHPETQQHIHFNVFGKSLRDFMALLSYCDAIIGNEGGAINMAKALNVKTFAIYAPWISKATWRIFEDDVDYVSVHLKEYDPEKYTNIKRLKTLLPNVLELYKAFEPSLFKDKLQSFLKNI